MHKHTVSNRPAGGGTLGSFSHTASAEGSWFHLFQWKFNDIANECETVLGPRVRWRPDHPPAEHKRGRGLVDRLSTGQLQEFQQLRR